MSNLNLNVMCTHFYQPQSTKKKKLAVVVLQGQTKFHRTQLQITKSFIWWDAMCSTHPCVCDWYDSPLGNNTTFQARPSKTNGLVFCCPLGLSDGHGVWLVLMNKKWFFLHVTVVPWPLKHHYLQWREVKFSNKASIYRAGRHKWKHSLLLLLLYVK